MKTSNTSRLARILTVALAVCLLACLLVPTSALAANDAVNACRYGVLQVSLNYIDDDNTAHTVSTGTGFLVNDNTLVTCHHVVNLSDGDLETLATGLGKTIAEIRSRLSITVTVSRDVTIPATKLTESFEMDFAILRLSSSLQGKTPLTIRTGEVKQTEDVYTIGFPALGTLLQSYNTFTSDDATITSGVVNKVAIGTNMHSRANTNYIQTSCNLDHGNSGGPMVDENGYVIGISQGVWFWEGEQVSIEYYNAIAIGQVTEVLDALGIVYTPAPAPGSEPQPTTPPVTTPVATAPQVTVPVATNPATLPSLDIPDPQPGSNNMTLILIIAAVAVVVIVVVVVVVVAGGKKKPQPQPVFTPPAPPAPPVRPATPPTNTGFAPPPSFPAQDAGETTVLSGAGETTVLTRNTVSGGTLIRKRTGESVSINTDQFVIGRERKGVNFCISDNSSISRNHVRLTVRGGVTYLTDLNAANGTFVNGVKVTPRQEIALKNGDKITLADEDLEFRS